jgi:hypothetical protein
VNKNIIPDATNATLWITSTDYSHSGTFEVLVYNSAGSVISYPATVVVMPLPKIIQHPQSVSVRIRPDPMALATTNASFTVVATSELPLSYQWRFNGVDIPGATNTTLVITNVQLQNAGYYSVVVKDMYGSIESQPAKLTPLIRPIFILPPMSQSVPSNSTITVSGTWLGYPPPFTTEWRRVSTILSTEVTTETNSFFEITATMSALYRLVVKNEAMPNGSAVSFTITVVDDSDNDGMPDAWEAMFGLDSNNSQDRDLDTDGDGVSNYKEFIAGTDPTDPQSYPRIDALIVNTNEVELKFIAVSNRTYSIEYSTGFESGLWKKLMDIPARTNTTPETIVFPLERNSRNFYRLVTPRVK